MGGLKSRLEHLEGKVGEPGMIPRNERIRVLIKEGEKTDLDLEEEKKAIEKEVMEKYGTIIETFDISLPFFSMFISRFALYRKVLWTKMYIVDK